MKHKIRWGEDDEEERKHRTQPRKHTNRDAVIEATGRSTEVETREKLAGPLAQAALERLREAAR